MVGGIGEEALHSPYSSARPNVEDLPRVATYWGEEKLIVEQHGKHVVAVNDE